MVKPEVQTSATVAQPNMKDYDGTKQGCHHLQATSTNRGSHNNQQVEFSIDTTSTLSSTNS